MTKGAGFRAPRSVLVTALVAVLVIAGALATAAVLRLDGESSAAAPPGGPPAVDPGCGAGPCTTVASAQVNGEPVELLVNAQGTGGRVRFGAGPAATVIETALTGTDVTLTAESLRCTDGTVPLCLVRGPFDEGMVGEVLVKRNEGWEPTGQPYFSDAGAIVLDDVHGDSTAEIVRVQRDCDENDGVAACRKARVLANVIDIDGAVLGCTKTYRTVSEFAGWPEIRIEAAELQACS